MAEKLNMKCASKNSCGRGFCCTISFNSTGAREAEAMLNDLLPEIQVIWINRYACGNDGGWLNRLVESDGELHDLVWLVGVKVKLKKER